MSHTKKEPSNLMTPTMRKAIDRAVRHEKKLTKDGPMAVVDFYVCHWRRCRGCKTYSRCYFCEVKTPGIFCGIDWACFDCIARYVAENIAESKMLARVNAKMRRK